MDWIIRRPEIITTKIPSKTRLGWWQELYERNFVVAEKEVKIAALINCNAFAETVHVLMSTEADRWAKNGHKNFQCTYESGERYRRKKRRTLILYYYFLADADSIKKVDTAYDTWEEIEDSVNNINRIEEYRCVNGDLWCCRKVAGYYIDNYGRIPLYQTRKKKDIWTVEDVKESCLVFLPNYIKPIDYDGGNIDIDEDYSD